MKRGETPQVSEGAGARGATQPLLFTALVFGRGLACCPLVSFCPCQGSRLVTEGIVIMVESYCLLTGPCGSRSLLLYSSQPSQEQVLVSVL